MHNKRTKTLKTDAGLGEKKYKRFMNTLKLVADLKKENNKKKTSKNSK